MWDLSPRIIEGTNVRLEPLAQDHINDLCECLLGETDGWFATRYGLNSPEVLSAAIENRIKANDDCKSMSFVSRDKISGMVAGLSHFMRIDEQNRQLEIGGTQIGRRFRRTHVNTENKLLMLRDAFERLGTVRVYFKVDPENYVSQNGVLRVGAKFEGELRKDAVLPNGTARNYLIYSIIDSEWGEVKALLERLLNSHAALSAHEQVKPSFSST
jgi:RimJ/RimL family protein N-acetyltransferase